MQQGSATIIEPTPRTTVVFLSACVLVAFVAGTIFFLPAIAIAYYQGPGGAGTRHHLGFELKPVSVRVDDHPREVWAFANIRADGPLARAGIRDGDIWVEAVYRTCGMDQRPDVVRIYEMLAVTVQAPVRMRVIHVTEVDGLWWKHVRQVPIPASQ